MVFLRRIFDFMFSPRLYRIYTSENDMYQANSLEKWGNIVIISVCLLWNTTMYLFPIFAYIAHSRGYFRPENLGHTAIFIGSVFGLLMLHVFLRSIGRATNPTYVSFYNAYTSAIQNYNATTKKELQKYEFDFSFWPVDFDYNSQEKTHGNIKCRESSLSVLNRAFSGPQSLIGFVAIQTFGIKIMYPGSISVLNYAIQDTLHVGRKKLIEKNGERFKLQTPDNNMLDVMFVDRRGKTINGSTLVICTEGNGGFYEVGIMISPMDTGYSVLGWNHPGFGSSTGTPFMNSEKCAAETVLQFAFQKLNFIPENVVLFGWSIGGYVSSIAARNYPNIKAVVLDATFDDVLPLAKRQLPSLVEGIVEVTIRAHANLNIGENLVKYDGPIRLIRRSEDEIICLIPGDPSTNCLNYLLIRLLKSRYPNLFVNETESALWEWLSVTGSKQDQLLQRYGVNVQKCRDEYIRIPKRVFPAAIGDNWSAQEKLTMLLYLANVYQKDYPSTHCTTLPPSIFESLLNDIDRELSSSPSIQ